MTDSVVYCIMKVCVMSLMDEDPCVFYLSYHVISCPIMSWDEL